MDTNKNNASLGQNTNPDPTTSLEDVVPTVSPTAGNAIFSSSDLPAATPANAPLPTDPLHPVQTVGTGKGDVVVGGREKRPLNKIAIVAILVALFLVGIIIFVIVAGSKVDRSELAVAFSKYRSLVETGPEGYSPEADIVEDETPSVFNEEVDNPDPVDPEETIEIDNEIIEEESAEETIYNQWFFFNVAQSKLSEDEKTTYFNDIATTYENFLSMTKHAKSDIKTELVTRAESYDEMLNLYITTYFLESTHDKMLETLLSDGEEATAKYIEQALPKEPKGAMAKSAWGFLYDELHYWQDVLGAYVTNNCVVNNEIDAECAAQLYESNSDFAQLFDKYSANYNGMTQIARIMKADFYNQTLEISNLLGGANEE